ncbi:ABC transporter substrate-binding protein [Streptomyces sp. NPDC059169]|uniref:ABC transporter substrate-binding protein n=1 Tax=unclassified Streptomyces TaxID=2593676 RepID=UPI0036963846
MERQTGWQFLDDRGHMATADRRPVRVVAYVQAGATLFDHGIRPVALYGSHHDAAGPDRTKTGALPLEGIAYLGSGAALGADVLLGTRPDLVLAVSYGGGQVYGLAPETAKQVEERVPLVVLDVGPGRAPADVRTRFTALARALGAGESDSGAAALGHAADRLRAAARRCVAPPVVLALSPASADGAHLAKPASWPDLRELTGLGLHLVAPEGGPSSNWFTTDWSYVARAEPRVVLVDVRANAYPLAALRDDTAWRAAVAGAVIVPWNPEAPCSEAAHARFFDEVADAVEACRNGGSGGVRGPEGAGG